MARQPGLRHELVLIDQSQLRQRQRELHASREQSLTRLPLELLNGLPKIPAHDLRLPSDPLQGARHDVLLLRVDRPGEGLHPIRTRSRQRRRTPPCLHHFVSHSAKEEGIGLLDVLDRVAKHVFVREHDTMIAAPVQCDVDGIPKGSHYVLLKRAQLLGGHQNFPRMESFDIVVATHKKIDLVFRTRVLKRLCCKNSLIIQDVAVNICSLWNVAKIFFATEPMSRAAGLVTILSSTDLFTEVRRPSQPLGESGK